MNEFFDIYCERTGPGLWAEPLSAVSNFAFFIAAYFAWRLIKRERVSDSGSVLLLILLITIGTGSTLFHTLAVRWAMLADTIPILLYQIAFLTLYTRRITNWPWVGVGATLAGFFACIYGFGMLPQSWLNGSLSYGPAFIFLLGFGFYHARNGRVFTPGLLLAAGVFALSLTFRSLDMQVCEALPVGLHYFWHMLNACVLYLTLRVYILNAPPRHRNKNNSPGR